ncbi:MAG: hypothetical protein QG646_2148 [Euryarchaeota archaeon]|nr:hypothetical protein [Euryarchaeota archaeon]
MTGIVDKFDKSEKIEKNDRNMNSELFEYMNNKEELNTLLVSSITQFFLDYSLFLLI